MKIGIITDCLDDSSAGISVFTFNIIKNIIRLDKKNEYILIHHTSNDIQIYKDVKELIIPIPKFPFGREIRKIFILPRTLEKQGFNLIHDPTQIGCPFFFKSKFMKIVTVHDLVPLIFPKTQSFTSYIHHKFGMKIILSNVDLIFADSENTKRDIIDYFHINPERIKIIYGGYEKQTKKVSPVQSHECLKRYGINNQYLLYVGTLEPRKNIANLITAYVKSGVTCDLVIAGKKGWKYDEIFKTVQDLGMQDKIIFTGFVKDEDLPIIYRNALAFTFPSLYEGFGLPVLEAMANGCPVITSNISSLPEVGGDAVLYVDPSDIDSIKDAIIKVQDKAIRKELIKKGLKQSKKFIWKREAQKIINEYNLMN